MNRGSVERVRGKYRVRFRIDGRKRTVATCATRDDAERMRAAFASQLDDRAYLIAGGQTFREFGELLLDEREVSGVRGIAKERSLWLRHVAGAPFAEMPLDSIRPPTFSSG